MLTNYGKNVNIFTKHFILVKFWGKIQVHMLQLYGVELSTDTLKIYQHVHKNKYQLSTAKNKHIGTF